MGAYRNHNEAAKQQLLATLQTVSPDQRERMLEDVRRELGASAVAEQTKSKREALWHYQLDTLCRKGAAEMVGVKEDTFLSFLEPLKAKFLAASGKLDCIVLPPNFITPTQKMKLVEVDNKRGHSYLNPVLIYPADGVKRSDAPYLMLNVEDGRAMQNVSPNNCVKHFAEDRRLGCTADEGETIAIYWPDTLKHHYIDCPGSRYGCGYVPCVGIWDGEPRLDARYSDGAYSYYGSASCGSIYAP